jgi:hypothetical protein
MTPEDAGLGYVFLPDRAVIRACRISHLFLSSADSLNEAVRHC